MVKNVWKWINNDQKRPTVFQNAQEDLHYHYDKKKRKHLPLQSSSLDIYHHCLGLSTIHKLEMEIMQIWLHNTHCFQIKRTTEQLINIPLIDIDLIEENPQTLCWTKLQFLINFTHRKWI